jgi:hypothetical protein
MAHDFIKAMDDEIAGLEAELARNPRYVKLKELRRLQALYAEEAIPNARASGRRAVRTKTGRRASPQRQAIIDSAAGILRAHLDQHLPTLPMSTPNLLALLTASGVKVTGKNPRNNLSAILSASEQFESHGRAGWTLAAPENTETADHDPTGMVSAVSAEPRLTSGEESSGPVNPWPGGGT